MNNWTEVPTYSSTDLQGSVVDFVKGINVQILHETRNEE